MAHFVTVACPFCDYPATFYTHTAGDRIRCYGCDKEYLWRHQLLKKPQQQATQSQSSSDPCNSAGTSDSAPTPLKRSQQILDLLDQVTVLHLKCAGISYGLSTRNGFFDQRAVGTSDQEKLADRASATFANLQSTLFNLFTLAKIAEDNLILNLKELDSSTGGPTKTP